MLGWKDDSEADRTLWEGTKTQIHSILAEDLRLFPKIQNSLSSGVLTGMPMSSQERAIYWYQEEVDRLIGPENIPEELRIIPVLAGQIAG
jgi:hypothetical protein